MIYEVCYVNILGTMEIIKIKNKSWPNQGQGAKVLEKSLSPIKLNKSVF